MVEVPVETPVTWPVLLLTVAVPVALLVQAPPEVASVNVIVAPTHTFDDPVIAAGVDTTVTGVVTAQPVLSV